MEWVGVREDFVQIVECVAIAVGCVWVGSELMFFIIGETVDVGVDVVDQDVPE